MPPSFSSLIAHLAFIIEQIFVSRVLESTGYNRCKLCNAKCERRNVKCLDLDLFQGKIQLGGRAPALFWIFVQTFQNGFIQFGGNAGDIDPGRHGVFLVMLFLEVLR